MKLSNLWTQPICADPPRPCSVDDDKQPAPVAIDNDDNLLDEYPFHHGTGRNRFRFVTTPDGDQTMIPASIGEQEWADLFAEAEALPSKPADAVGIATVPSSEPIENRVQSIAQAVLSACPESLAAVAQDSKGRLLGATVTQAPKGLTPAVFRAAFRSLPERCKSVTFAAHTSIASDVRDAATQAGEHFLIRVLGYVAVD